MEKGGTALANMLLCAHGYYHVSYLEGNFSQNHARYVAGRLYGVSDPGGEKEQRNSASDYNYIITCQAIL